jgi:hypothetical protein
MSDDRTRDRFSEEPLPPGDGGQPRHGWGDDEAVRPVRRERAQKGSSVGLVLAIIGGALVLVLGCGGLLVVLLVIPAVQKVREAADRTQRINALSGIGKAYHNHWAAFNSKAPQKAEDLDQFLADYPEARARLRDGSVVLVYGVRLRDMMPEGTSNTVLGYEREVPERGGLVLMGDGAVFTVTAAEFATKKIAQKREPK